MPVGAVCLVVAVARVAIGQQCFLSYIVCSHGQRAFVGRKLVPQGTDAILASRAVVKIGVGEVKSYILYAYHHALARVCLGETFPLISLVGVHTGGHRVHRHLTRTAGLNAGDRRFARQGSQLCQGNVRDVYVAKLCQRFAAMRLEQLLAITCHTDKSA